MKNSLISSEKGATAIEYSIILPFLVLFFVVLIETGMYVYNQTLIHKAAKEAVREASLGSDMSKVEAKFRKYFGNDLDRNNDGTERDNERDRERKRMVDWGIKVFERGLDDSEFNNFTKAAAQGNYDSVTESERNIADDGFSGKIAVLVFCHNNAIKLNLTGLFPSRICTWNLTRYERYAN